MANDTKDTQAAQFDVSESTGYQAPRNGGLQGSAHAERSKSGAEQGSATAVREDASAQADPRHHTSNVKRKLQELRDHLREDVEKVTEPKAQALFETTAEVLQGLLNAFDHYEHKSEPGMR
jgi:hypothetical protein